MFSIATCVPSSFNPSDEPCYAVPSASYNYPNNPIPRPAVITPPTAPTGLVASNITANSFTISWTAGTGAVNYVINWSTFSYVLSSVSTSFTLTGLPSSTTANIIVSAVNAGGSALSTPLSVSTLGVAPSGLVATNITSSTFLCTWTYVAGVTYTLQWGAFNGTITGNGTGSFAGLDPQTTNNLILNADGTPSAPVSVTTAPDFPPTPAVNRRGTTYLILTFKAEPNVTYSAVYGVYTGIMTTSGEALFNNLPVGYSADGQLTATNITGSATTPFSTITLLTPIVFDTGNQNQLIGAAGTFLGPLNPGFFNIPVDFDEENNGTFNTITGGCDMPFSFINVNAGFDYGPVPVISSGGLFSLRFASLTMPNANGSGSPGSSWQNEIACYETGDTQEFNNLSAFTAPQTPWKIANSDTITVYLLIAYPAWLYRTYDAIIDPTAMIAYWRVNFTYNPFATS